MSSESPQTTPAERRSRWQQAHLTSAIWFVAICSAPTTAQMIVASFGAIVWAVLSAGIDWAERKTAKVTVDVE